MRKLTRISTSIFIVYPSSKLGRFEKCHIWGELSIRYSPIGGSFPPIDRGIIGRLLPKPTKGRKGKPPVDVSGLGITGGYVADQSAKSKDKAKGEGQGGNKKDKQQVDAAAKKKGIRDRRGFGDYIEDRKRESGRGGADNFTWKELLELADEFKLGGGL